MLAEADPTTGVAASEQPGRVLAAMMRVMTSRSSRVGGLTGQTETAVDDQIVRRDRPLTSVRPGALAI